jgi:hypothetical protein
MTSGRICRSFVRVDSILKSVDATAGAIDGKPAD